MFKCMVACVVVLLLISFTTVALAAPPQIYTEVYNDWYIKRVGHRTVTVVKEYYASGKFLYSTSEKSYGGSSNYIAKPYYTDGNKIIFRYDSSVSPTNIEAESPRGLMGYTLIGVYASSGKSIFKHVSASSMTNLVSKHPYRATHWNDIYITSKYGKRIDPITGEEKFHNGIDYGTRLNKYCLTTTTKSGKVNFYQQTTGYGLYANIESTYLGSAYKLRYAHMSFQEIVHQGKTVSVNTIIGKTGTTGSSTGIHLHLEVFKKGIRINPEITFSTFHKIGDMYR